jgi:octopamine receptor alpha
VVLSYRPNLIFFPYFCLFFNLLQETKFSNPKTIPMPPGPSACKEKLTMPHNPTLQHQQEIATIEQPPKNANGTTEQQVPGTSAVNVSIPVVTCDFASDVSTSEAGAENENEMYRDTLRVDGCAQDGKSRLSTLTELPVNSKNGSSTVIEGTNPGTTQCKKLPISPNTARCRALSVGIDHDAVSEFEPSSSDSGVVSRCAVVKPLKFRLCQPIFGKRSSKSTNKDQHHHNHHHNGNKKHKNHKPKTNATPVAITTTPNCEIEPALPKPKPRDPEKEKRRIARKKEKRATLILGLIMGSFIACWLPFFFLYILVPACPSCTIPDSFFAVAFWLGMIRCSTLKLHCSNNMFTFYRLHE